MLPFSTCFSLSRNIHFEESIRSPSKEIIGYFSNYYIDHVELPKHSRSRKNSFVINFNG